MQGYVQIENRNMYREGFFKILRTNFGSGLGSRLPLLAILLLQNIGNANFCKARNGMSSEEGRGGTGGGGRKMLPTAREKFFADL